MEGLSDEGGGAARDGGAGEGGVRAALEAVLLVSDGPMTAAEAARAVGVGAAEARRELAGLAEEYERAGRGVRLREAAGGWRLCTDPALHGVVEAYLGSREPRRLSQAALESLAVIAYTQPATREEVRAVRGVSSDSAIGTLLERGLVREAGRREGGAVEYATTDGFLELVGLPRLADLPPLEQFAPDEATRARIRERLGALGQGRAPQDEDSEEDG